MGSNINDLVLESLAGAGMGLLGRGVANLGGNLITNIAGGAGFTTMSPTLTGAAQAAVPGALAGTGATTLGALPIGQILTGALGAYQQHQLNNLKQQYNQLMGIQQQPDKFWDTMKIAGTGLASSVPLLGGLMNMYKGSQIQDMKDKINQMQAYDGYMNRMNGNPPQLQPQMQPQQQMPPQQEVPIG